MHGQPHIRFTCKLIHLQLVIFSTFYFLFFIFSLPCLEHLELVQYGELVHVPVSGQGLSGRRKDFTEL